MATAANLNAGDWRARLGSRLVSPDEALSHVKSGDRIVISLAQATPFTLCTALAGAADGNRKRRGQSRRDAV